MADKIPPIRPDYDKPNYDKSKIAPYTLEDPLTFVDGTKVKTPAEWERRRQEIIDIFAKKMFGAIPPAPKEMYTELVEEKEGVLAGFGIRSQYKMYFKKDHSGPVIDWLLLRPHYAKKPVPVIFLLNFGGNFQFVPDEEVIVPEMWARTSSSPDHKLPLKRGSMCDPRERYVCPVNVLLAAGYAIMTACYCQVSPDPDSNEKEAKFAQNTFSYTGVFDLFGKRDPARRDNTGSIGAWAWALSRGMDLAETIPALDTKKSIVTGCSRLGKTALLAASRDERFAVCAPIQCGGGGVTLTKRDFGENIATEMRMFPHWYCEKYGDYKTNPAKLLDFDQHLLAASIAPRRLLVCGFDEGWFDTEGEYLACKAASPAWEFLGKEGMPGSGFPDDYDTSCIGKDLGYYRRTEEHGTAACDWLQIIRFASF